MISSKTRKFLKAWLKWAENGAPEDEPFRRSEGLCFSTSRFSRSDGSAIEAELDRLYKKCGLEVVYPFGEKRFDKRISEQTQHRDPRRLLFVRTVLAMSSKKT